MSKQTEIIKELETLLSFTNVDLNDDYHRGAKGVATMALKAIKELKKEFISSKVDYSIEKNEIIEGLLKENKQLQKENMQLKEKIKVEATKIYNTTKDNKYN
jgi:hypothetical protein